MLKKIRKKKKKNQKQQNIEEKLIEFKNETTIPLPITLTFICFINLRGNLKEHYHHAWHVTQIPFTRHLLIYHLIISRYAISIMPHQSGTNSLEMYNIEYNGWLML